MELSYLHIARVGSFQLGRLSWCAWKSPIETSRQTVRLADPFSKSAFASSGADEDVGATALSAFAY